MGIGKTDAVSELVFREQGMGKPLRFRWVLARVGEPIRNDEDGQDRGGDVVKGLASVVLLSMLWAAGLAGAATEAEWAVTWYPMTAPGEFNAEVMLAKTVLPWRIQEDWGSGSLLGETHDSEIPASHASDDRVGFHARCEIVLEEAGLYRFVLLANNGVSLDIDGETVLRSWENVLSDGGGVRSVAASRFLETGPHLFELWYYEWEGAALLHFVSNL